MVQYAKGPMDAITWGDTTVVTVINSHPSISATSNQQLCTAIRRIKLKQKGFYRANIWQPEIVHFFQKNMGGVDLL